MRIPWISVELETGRNSKEKSFSEQEQEEEEEEEVREEFRRLYPTYGT